jgi:hypothetical protein
MRNTVYSNTGVELALASAVQAASVKGPGIDLLGFESVAFALSTGAVVGDGDFGVTLQESDDDVDGHYTDADASVIDTNAPASLAASSAYKLAYRGFKRFARLSLVKAGGTSIAAGATALLGNASTRPVA